MGKEWLKSRRKVGEGAHLKNGLDGADSLSRKFQRGPERIGRKRASATSQTMDDCISTTTYSTASATNDHRGRASTNASRKALATAATTSAVAVARRRRWDQDRVAAGTNKGVASPRQWQEGIRRVTTETAYRMVHKIPDAVD